jgi:hypothetical protein
MHCNSTVIVEGSLNRTGLAGLRELGCHPHLLSQVEAAYKQTKIRNTHCLARSAGSAVRRTFQIHDDGTVTVRVLCRK